MVYRIEWCNGALPNSYRISDEIQRFKQPLLGDERIRSRRGNGEANGVSADKRLHLIVNLA